MVQKAFGASKAEIMFKHVCKNVLLPVITKLGMALPTLVTGAVITETVFSWPGIGPYFIKAVQGMDYPIVMIVLILSSTLVVLGNLLSDILYCVTDPRIRKMGKTSGKCLGGIKTRQNRNIFYYLPCTDPDIILTGSGTPAGTE